MQPLLQFSLRNKGRITVHEFSDFAVYCNHVGELVRNVDSWAHPQTHIKKNSGGVPQHLWLKKPSKCFLMSAKSVRASALPKYIHGHLLHIGCTANCSALNFLLLSQGLNSFPPHLFLQGDFCVPPSIILSLTVHYVPPLPSPCHSSHGQKLSTF